MRGIIWAYNFKDGIQYLNEQIIEDYKKVGINAARKANDKFRNWVQFDNGDYWQVIFAGEPSHARGNKANISYIDYRISQEIVDTVITPSTICPPYQAIRYYYPPDKKE